MKTWTLKTPFLTLQGTSRRCLDWSRAIEIIKKYYKPNMRVWAGVKGDWPDTAGLIFKDGQSVDNDAVVIASRINDEPAILIKYEDGTWLEGICWGYENELGYVGNKWPHELLLNG